MSGVVGKLTQGAADAGFVYATDVAAAGDKLEDGQAPGGSPAHGGVRRRGGEGRGRARGRAGVHRRAAGRSGTRGDGESGVPAAAVRSPFAIVLVACLTIVLGLPHPAARRDLRRRGARGAALEPGRPGSGGRARAEPRGHEHRARADRARRHPRGLAARHPPLPRPRPGHHAGGAAAGGAARRRGHRRCSRLSGRAGSSAGRSSDAGVELVFQTAGVVVALVFVASPFYIRQALAAFAALDPSLMEASRTLGASEARTFARVAVPNAMPGLVAGGALAWGRALGEFGATLVFAGSLSRRHPDGAAGDLRALRRRLHRRPGPVRGDDRAERGDPPGREARRRRPGAGRCSRLRRPPGSGPSSWTWRSRSRPARALPWPGPRAPARRPRCGWPPGLLRPDARHGSRAARSCGSTPRRGIDVPPERRGVGYVFQDYALFPNLERVAQRRLRHARAAAGRAARAARASCSTASGWRLAPTRRPATLSGGERQRVALARALAREPARAAARRAAVGARRPHPGERAARELGAVLAAGRRAGAAGHPRLRGGRAAGRSRRR